MESSSDHKLIHLPHWAQSFIAGGTAGTFAKSTIAPLERVKILFQIQSRYYPYAGILSTIKEITKKEGVTGLWKGNAATVVRIFPYAAIQFLSFDTFRKTIWGDRDIKNMSPWVNLLAGSMAGATSVIFTYPLDLVRVRLAVEVEKKKYSGIMSCIRSIVQTQGFLGLFRGMSPTLMGIIPYAGVNFSTFEFLKSQVKKRTQSDLSIYSKLACGGIAGAIGQTVTYPFDVVRRQMQTEGVASGHGRVYKSTWDGLTTIVAKDGYMGLWRGISINYLRVGPQVAISFTTYETVKKWMEKNT